jgi:ubiquinol-cytochrome c reductase cytochrome b/c1 subunit
MKNNLLVHLIGVIFPPTYVDFSSYAWGGRSVGTPTLKRFYTLHFLLPILTIGFMFLHLYLLHIKGSTNPLGIVNRIDEIRFYPKYVIKDVFGLLLIGGSLFMYLVFNNPFFICDPDNYIEANPLSTPKHITPEWYFLPFYGMLRSIPDKIKGVCIMFAAILVLFFLPFIPFKGKTSSFCNVSQFFFWLFTSNFIFLG